MTFSGDRYPQDRRPGAAQPGYGPYDAAGPQDQVPGYRMQRPRSGGFRGFPFPHYSTRTRRGTQVSVGGCCLPIPLGCLTMLAAGAGVAVSRVISRRRSPHWVL